MSLLVTIAVAQPSLTTPPVPRRPTAGNLSGESTSTAERPLSSGKIGDLRFPIGDRPAAHKHAPAFNRQSAIGNRQSARLCLRGRGGVPLLALALALALPVLALRSEEPDSKAAEREELTRWVEERAQEEQELEAARQAGRDPTVTLRGVIQFFPRGSRPRGISPEAVGWFRAGADSYLLKVRGTELDRPLAELRKEENEGRMVELRGHLANEKKYFVLESIRSGGQAPPARFEPGRGRGI
jgi:hypothetical protein